MRRILYFQNFFEKLDPKIKCCDSKDTSKNNIIFTYRRFTYFICTHFVLYATENKYIKFDFDFSFLELDN